MIRRLILASIFLWNQSVFAALPVDVPLKNPSDPFYNVKADPLPRPIIHLLMDNHYFVHSNGSIWSPSRKQEIRKSQIRVLIRRLKSTERLKAMLKIDLILSENPNGHLTPDELKKVRHILKDVWPFFTIDNRKHFSRYFSREELYSLNLTPPDEDSDPDLLSQTPLGTPPPPPLPAGFLSQIQAAPESAPAAPLASQKALGPIQNSPLVSNPTPFLPPSQAPTSAPPVAVPNSELSVSPPTAAPVVSQTTSLPAPVSTAAASPALPSAQALAQSSLPPAVAVAAVSSPVLGHVAQAAAVPVQAVSHALSLPASAPAQVTSVVRAPVLSSSAFPAKPAIPAPVPASISSATAKASVEVLNSSATLSQVTVNSIRQALASSSVIGSKEYGVSKPKGPTPLPPLKSYALPALSVVSPADFEKFLLNAPYSQDPKGLLRLINSDAQEPFRSRALNIVMNLTPAIVIDSDQLGKEAHQKTFLKQNAEGRFEATVAINPNPILASKREFIFEDWKAMLPVSSSAYQTMGVPVPSVKALDISARPDKVESGDWGTKTQIYSDGSERGNYSSFEMAGFLLHGLLDLEARIEGWSAFPYQEESYAYSAQMLLYAQIKDGAKTADFLDPQMRALFEDWLNHPARFHDFIIHSLASGQNSLWDLRHIGASRRDYFIRKSYVACPKSLAKEKSLKESESIDSTKKEAMSLARAHFVSEADFERALNSLDFKATAIEANKKIPSRRDCINYWQKEFMGSNVLNQLMDEAATAEKNFREKTGAPYVP